MKKLLLIDDDVVLQKIYKDRLTSEGYELAQSANGQVGIAQAKTLQPALILLDVMLPGGLNGFDVLEQLKRQPETKDIPVIMLTNLDAEEKSARTVGAADYINKAATSLDIVVERIKTLT